MLTRLVLVLILIGAGYYLTGDLDFLFGERDGAAPRLDIPLDEAGGEALRVGSWNLYNFGKSKDDVEMAFIAGQVPDVDVLAIQEVSTLEHGEDAVMRLTRALAEDGKGTWAYVVSEPTSGRGSERYAFLWRPDRARLVGQPWLEPSLAEPIDREPFLARFERLGQTVLIASFHAVPSGRSPHREISLLGRIPDRYPDEPVLIVGDFNLAPTHSAYDALVKRNLLPALADQLTTIKQRRDDEGNRLANPYDNILYDARRLRPLAAGAVDFTEVFPTLRDARALSDHLPVYFAFTWK